MSMVLPRNTLPLTQQLLSLCKQTGKQPADSQCFDVNVELLLLRYHHTKRFGSKQGVDLLGRRTLSCTYMLSCLCSDDTAVQTLRLCDQEVLLLVDSILVSPGGSWFVIRLWLCKF